MIVAIVDCETTGLGSDDEPISIAIILASVNAKGEASIIYRWHGEQCPSVPIHPRAYATHGLTVEALAGKTFDVRTMAAMFARTDVLIAHNAKFDARMIRKVWPGVDDKEWRCSYRQWVWPDMRNKKLDTVCEEFGINRPAVHDSLADAEALLSALQRRSGKTDRSMTYLAKLLRKASFDVQDYPAYGWGNASTHVTVATPKQEAEPTRTDPAAWMKYVFWIPAWARRLMALGIVILAAKSCT